GAAGALPMGEPEQVERRGRVGGGIEPRLPETGPELHGDDLGPVVLSEPAVLPEDFEDWQIGHAMAIRHAVALEPRDRAPGDAPAELGEQPRFADVRLAHHAQHL